MSDYEDILYEERADGVARITINRPDRYNAFRGLTVEELIDAFQRAGWNRDIGVIVLTGAGDKAFASGTDISQFKAFKTAEDALAYESRIDRVVGTLERCRVPTIAAIAGACTGG
ncbi:MAG: enoyl-CoA hydratase-related protein, partial [Rhizobiaceae bacterium]